MFALAPESLDSQACRSELLYASRLALARSSRRAVIQELVPPALAAIQHVDYRRKDKQALLSLIKALNAVPRSPPLPNPLPLPPVPPVSYLGALKEEIDAPKSLSFEEQSALLLKLKQALSNAKTAHIATELLRRFRMRDDLLARVAREIDAALESGASPQPHKTLDADVVLETPLDQQISCVKKNSSRCGPLRLLVFSSSRCFGERCERGGASAMPEHLDSM